MKMGYARVYIDDLECRKLEMRFGDLRSLTVCAPIAEVTPVYGDLSQPIARNCHAKAHICAELSQ
jgi:hypothetical protein